MRLFFWLGYYFFFCICHYFLTLFICTFVTSILIFAYPYYNNSFSGIHFHHVGLIELEGSVDETLFGAVALACRDVVRLLVN